jgi:hypothetical protein
LPEREASRNDWNADRGRNRSLSGIGSKNMQVFKWTRLLRLVPELGSAFIIGPSNARFQCL